MAATGSVGRKAAIGVAALGFAGALAPAALAQTDYAPAIAALEREIPAMMAAQQGQGLMVTLVDGQRTVWARGFGWADRDAGRPVTDRTLFHIGSVTKTFASIAVMQLVADGEVDLDAPLSRYVPGFRLKPNGAERDITVRSVLTHHSGIPGDVFNGAFTEGRPNRAFDDWLLRTLPTMYRERRVNTELAYNNSGFVLLGNLIENVTGMTVEQYMQQRIFRPAGMRTAHYDDRIPRAREITRNYTATTDDAGRPTGAEAAPREYVNAGTAGAIMASARDMSGYLSMLVSDGRGASGRVLAPGTLGRMWTPQLRLAIDAQSPVRFGLGWALTSPSMDWAGPVRWHDGGTTWQFSMLKVLPRTGLGVFVSVNTAGSGDLNGQVADAVLSAAYTTKTGRRAPTSGVPSSTPVWMTADQLKSYSGRYANADTLRRVDVSGDGQGLVVRTHPGTPVERATTYRPYADGWFRADNPATAPVRFPRVGGRALLAIGTPASGRVWSTAAGERIGSSRITQAWRDRMGVYRVVGAVPFSAAADHPDVLQLDVREGLLGLTAPGDAERRTLVVTSDRMARVAGLGPGLGRGMGDAVMASRTPSGGDAITFMGLRYVKQG